MWQKAESNCCKLRLKTTEEEKEKAKAVAAVLSKPEFFFFLH